MKVEPQKIQQKKTRRVDSQEGNKGTAIEVFISQVIMHYFTIL